MQPPFSGVFIPNPIALEGGPVCHAHTKIIMDQITSFVNLQL